MPNIIHSISKIGQRFLYFLIEDVRLVTYLLIYCLVTILLSILYLVLTPYGHGLGNNAHILDNVTFYDSLYFSVVTVSSLGYGDIVPIGFSKFIASAEVLFGLASLGIIIAKVTSRRLSHHVLRLYSTDAQKKLEEYSISFEQIHESLSQSMKDLGRAYQRTPDGVVQAHDMKNLALSYFRNLLSTFQVKSEGLSVYLSYEAQQGDFFNFAPVEAIRRLANSLDKGLLILGQLVISLSPEARVDILDGSNRQRIAEILDYQRIISNNAVKYTKNDEVKNDFIRITETCNKVPESYFAVPTDIAVAERPDQIIEPSDEPKEP